MGFLVDANVVVYSAVPSEYRAPCLEILEAVARRGAEGRLSTAVLEEVWHVELSGRAGDLDGLARSAYAVFAPLLPVTDDVVALALEIDALALGANDRIHAATCLVNELDVIVTADAAFEHVRGVRRVDPLDSRALRRLLRH